MKKLVAVALCAILGGCYQTSSSSNGSASAGIPLASPDQLRDLTAAEKAVLAKGFAAGLKDPASAKFEWAKIQKSLPMDGPLEYCAVVNAKNSFGGYVGAAPFLGIIMIVNGKIITGSMGAVGDTDPRYANIVPTMCREKGLNPYA